MTSHLPGDPSGTRADDPPTTEEEREAERRASLPLLPSGCFQKRHDDRPDPEKVRGVCPECAEQLVSVWLDFGAKGTIITFECWDSYMGGVCGYRRVI